MTCVTHDCIAHSYDDDGVAMPDCDDVSIRLDVRYVELASGVKRRDGGGAFLQILGMRWRDGIFGGPRRMALNHGKTVGNIEMCAS